MVERDDDVSGVTGTGTVAEFSIATDGRICIFWPEGHSYFPSLQAAIKVHGHNGKTRFVILDDEKLQVEHCARCHVFQAHGAGFTCDNHDFDCPGCLNGVS